MQISHKKLDPQGAGSVHVLDPLLLACLESAYLTCSMFTKRQEINYSQSLIICSLRKGNVFSHVCCLFMGEPHHMDLFKLVHLDPSPAITIYVPKHLLASGQLAFDWKSFLFLYHGAGGSHEHPWSGPSGEAAEEPGQFKAVRREPDRQRGEGDKAVSG